MSLGVYILDVLNTILQAQAGGKDPFLVDPSVDIETAVAATVILLFSGMLAGLIPAWRAMQIKAIDAIRDE